MSSDNKVLVLCATGKAGRNVSRALKEQGFDVFGTTRSTNNSLEAQGIHPIVCNYTARADIDQALSQSGAKKVFSITDFFGAAKQKSELEIEHGKIAIDAAKAAGVEHFIFMSVVDPELVNEHVKHFKTKLVIENYLKESGLQYSILRPTNFFENFDDAANYNPLKKGKLYFWSLEECKYCCTYDIGRAAAVMFKNSQEWYGKTLDVISWKGDLKTAAAALETVGGVPVKYGLAMPLFLRRLFLKDIHNMCLYYELEKGPKGEPEDFKKVVPNAFSAEDWFRFHGKYANGEKIGA